jgi:hypothetical protein
MTAIVLRGDAARLPLPDESVDLIVTSPPYWNLRDYRDGGESLKGQIGSEATPQEWLAALLECTREWMRVLKPEGSMFVDLGDKYSARADASAGRSGRRDHAMAMAPARNARGLGRPKSLLLLPERYRIGCVDQLGLIARAKIVWSKLSPLPESAADRVQTTHEDVVHLVKRPRYFSAVDEIRVPHSGGTHPGRRRSAGSRSGGGIAHRTFAGNTDQFSPLGKLPGSVWEIASVPLIVPERLQADHFAAYPPELVRRIVLGWSPSGICTECGAGRRPVTSQGRETYHGKGRHRSGARQAKDGAAETGWRQDEKRSTVTAITGYACGCPDTSAPTRPAVVADPFGGTGTTALVADVLGRTGVSVDLGADYCRIAGWRTADPAERARALGVAKPPPVLRGQGSLFDGLEAS